MPYQFIQASWVVEDLEQAMRRRQASASAGPFFVNPHVRLDNPLWRGVLTHYDTSIALAQAGPMQIELIQQHDDLRSPYRDVYAPGQEGFHHLACFVEDMEAEIASHRSRGIEVALDAMFGDVRVVYVDTRPAIGHMIELLEHKPSIAGIFAHVAAAAVGWDGSDPVRLMSQIPDRGS